MAKKLKVSGTTYKRKAWTDRFGHKHPAKVIHRKGYLTKDRGIPGRTPKSRRWYKPTTEMGWRKDMSAEERRELALDAHGGDLLSTARALLALSNVSTDDETKRLARSDADYFFREYRKAK